MTEIYILIAEYGEYENAGRNVLGVFSSAEAARAAIPRFKELGNRQLELYQDRQRRRDEYLQRYEPDKVIPPGSSLFPDGCIVHTNEHYKEADAAIGPDVPLIVDGDEYVVEQFTLDAVKPPCLRD